MMKRLTFLSVGLLIVPILFQMGLAQTAKAASPQVPITYQGDTAETIKRRAQWIEGAKKEGNLVWWGILSPTQAKKVSAEFNKVYPFITLQTWRGKGEEVAAKLEADIAGGGGTVDLVLGGEPYNFPRWRKMGAFDRIIDGIHNLKKFDKRMYSKYGDWIQPGNNGVTPAYNTKRVSAAEAPKTWEDILDPKWKGQVGLTTDVKVWMVFALEEGGWGVEKTEDFLRRLSKQKLIWGAGHTAGHSLLIAGDFKIFGESYVYHTLHAQDKGAPVEWSRVKPVVITGPSLALLKKAPNPNSARLLVEWLFSPQGQKAYDQITYYGIAAPGSGTRISRALEGLPLLYRTEEGELKAVQMGLAKRFEKALGTTQE